MKIINLLFFQKLLIKMTKNLQFNNIKNIININYCLPGYAFKACAKQSIALSISLIFNT